MGTIDATVKGIFTIAADGERMHLYADAAELRTSIQSITDGGLEFFDVRGHRLAPAFDPKWTLVRLHPVGDPDGAAVRARLDAVLAALRRGFENVRDDLCRIGAIPPGAAPPLPELAGRSLEEAFAALFAAGLGHRPQEVEARDSRDFWHNFWAHGLR